MKGVDLYARVRRAVYVDGMSQRRAARYFGIDPRTVANFSVPPGYQRSRRPARPKLDPFTGIIDQIPDDDGSIPAKQRQAAAGHPIPQERSRSSVSGGIARCWGQYLVDCPQQKIPMCPGQW
jgi:hypothetical protein